jgi:PEP-CTERM motif
MQKWFKLLIIPFLVLFLFPATSMAYTIDDKTDVGVGLSWDGGDPTLATYGSYGPYQDYLGAEFDTKGINVGFDGNELTLDLYTAFDGSEDVGGLELTLADLFLTVGSATYAIDLDASISGVYMVDSFDTSWNIVEGASGLLYGEVWYIDGSTTYSPWVQATGQGQTVNNLTASISSSMEGSLNVYSVSFDWTGIINAGSEFDIFWATATCGNDIIEGTITAPAPVPEPATMLLLGTGLIGLAGVGRKKLFKK